MRVIAVVAVAVAVLVSCSSDEGKSCNEAGCPQGLDVRVMETTAGAYTFEVVVDGERTTCSLTLPATDLAGSCPPGGGVYLGGGPGVGISIGRTDARSVTVRVTRDGVTIRDASFAPEYVVSPGPNGPGCPPEECRYATYTLP